MNTWQLVLFYETFDLTHTHVHSSTSRHKYYKHCNLTHTQSTYISVIVVSNTTLTLHKFKTAAFTVKNTTEVCTQGHQPYRLIFPVMVPWNVSKRLLTSERNNYYLETVGEVIKVLKKKSVTFLRATFFSLSYFTNPFLSHFTPRIIYFHSRAMLDSVLMENIHQYAAAELKKKTTSGNKMLLALGATLVTHCAKLDISSWRRSK